MRARRLNTQAAEQIQKAHYDQIASEYEAHYGDESSQDYRRRFIYEPLFDGLSLSKQNVLEAMCGSGQTTQFLLSQGASVTGLDVSPESIKIFESRWPQCNAVCAPILASGLDDESFDCVAVIGGLHHLHPSLNESIHEIHRLLKVGGYFCFAEPHSASYLDIVRRFWYKQDDLFSENEAAINVYALKKEFSSRFAFRKEKYIGNIGYLLVLNSMVFRIPPRFKSVYTPGLLALESFFGRWQGKRLSCAGLFQWQKR
ncbi:MAG: class I SAM-dependent methyltransferase [Pyrinomonadaceae bacterium]